MQDGIHGKLPRERMAPAVRKYWDFMDIKPDAPIYQREFGYYCLEKWRREEGLSPDADLAELFGFDAPALVTLGGLGGCEAEFEPRFEEAVLGDRARTRWCAILRAGMCCASRAGATVLCLSILITP